MPVRGLGGKQTQIIDYTVEFELDNMKYHLNMINNICMALPKVENHILDECLWLKTQKLASEIPRSYVGPQILVGLDVVTTISTPDHIQ